jgi:tetratricopeptide (TPR) repeat protein
MSAAQREQFDGLRVGATLRRVDQLREGGDTAEAYEVLAPQLTQRPTDSRLKLALARLHASVGDNDETLQTLDEVLLADPDNLDAWLSAAAIASSLREHDYALGALQRAETIAPSDSRVLAQYSRHYRARGELTRAAQYMRAAIASQRPIGSTAGSRAASETTWGRPLSADNPFAARGATRTGSNNPAESPADLRARRLPPLPGVVSPLAPQYSGPKTIPSSEDWLRGSRALRENTAPLDWPNAANGSDDFARPAQNGVSTNLTSPLQSRFATKHAPVPADIGALASETNSATAATITVAARQSVADMRRQELMPPDETWTADYPTTADVGTALGLADTGNALSAYDPPLDSRGQLGPRHARATDSTSPRQVRLMSAIAPTTDIPAYQLAQAGKRLPPGVSDGMSEPAAPMTRRGPAPSQSLRDELADIVAERGSREVEGAAALRWRNGEGGMSQLVELRSPVSLQMPLGDVGKLQLRVTPTLIDAGTSSTDAEAASRLGSQSLGGVPDGINVSAAGVGLRLGLSGHRWSADLGTTPIGFRLLNVVGGVQFSGEFTPQLGYGIELQRRAVTDSVLSYAGMRDPRTGTLWGGVTATGLGGSLQWKDGDIKLGSYADIQSVLGTGVHSNEKFEMGASATWQISDDAQQRTEFGARMGYQHYAHNLRFFTLGQGGYFSPQHQLTLSMPFKAVGHDNRVNWAISAAPGLNAWREDASAYFPTDPAAQRQLQTRVTLGQSTVASYLSRSSFGLSLNLQGGAEYALSSRLLVGSRLSLDSASQYTQLGASLYLRLRLDNDAAPQRVLIEPAPRHD